MDNCKIIEYYISLSQLIMKINQLGFFAILFLPLLAFGPFFPPEWGKAIAFRIIFSVILLFFIWRIISENGFWNEIKRKIFAHKKPFLLLAALFLIALSATIFSQDISFSLWASPHRSGGVINFIFCMLFAIILFLVSKNKDWQKFWDFSLIIGILAVLFGIVQYYNLLPKTIIDYESRPPSTMSIPALLALYLAILFFFALGSALREKLSKKAIFYWTSCAFFLFGIFISGARAAWLSVTVGFAYFFLFHPLKMPKLKIATLAVLLLSVFCVLYLNFGPLPAFIENNPRLTFIKSRLSFTAVAQDLGGTRLAAWQTFFEAVKERPLLGWGPENQAIAFDKYYDPSLPYLVKSSENWWDRAHNIFFDMAVQYGLPFLIVYLFLFAYLFWLLQKIKKNNPDRATDAQILQTIFIVYFINLFFEFESVSIALVIFFVIGYALFLTAPDLAVIARTQNEAKKTKQSQRNFKKNKLIFGILAAFSIWFLWQYAIKPLQINAQINKAKNLACGKRLQTLEKLFSQKSFLDAFLRSKYTDDIKLCENFIANDEENYIKKAINALMESAEIRPNYTRTYILLAQYNNVLIAREQNLETKKLLLKNSEDWLAKASELSPKRKEILSSLSETYFAYGNFEKMKENAEKCLALGKLGTCNWYLGLAEIALGQELEGEKNIELAKENGYSSDSQSSYNQLAIVYTRAQDYKKLVPIYQTLIKTDKQNIQYYATLAAVYKQIGDYKNARATALELLKLQPAAEAEVNEFLKSLPY